MRLQIEAIGIDAPVVSLGVEADGTMQSPSGPLDAGWYTFSAIPGAPGNAVFSGHVDFAKHRHTALDVEKSHLLRRGHDDASR